MGFEGKAGEYRGYNRVERGNLEEENGRLGKGGERVYKRDLVLCQPRGD